MVSTAGFSNFELQQLQNAQNNGALVSTTKTSEDSSIFADNKVTTNPSDEVQFTQQNLIEKEETKENKGLFSDGLLGIIPKIVGGILDFITGLLEKFKELLVGKDEEEAVDETPEEDAPSDVAPADEVPEEDAPSDAAPADEVPEEDAPSDAAPADEAPADESDSENGGDINIGEINIGEININY